MFMNKYDKVIENANIALSFGKNTETQIMLASAYSLTGKYDNARMELEDVLNIDPKNKTALLGLSVVFSKTDNKQKAIEILKKAQGYYPDDSEIKKQLGEIDK
ncbi:MAG: tetratricopeptide repeat protein [candidate division NC10 bacterium]|nr:tetratricopeptide repeat protein [candidate division NC10 bacterium]